MKKLLLLALLISAASAPASAQVDPVFGTPSIKPGKDMPTTDPVFGEPLTPDTTVPTTLAPTLGDLTAAFSSPQLTLKPSESASVTLTVNHPATITQLRTETALKGLTEGDTVTGSVTLTLQAPKDANGAYTTIVTLTDAAGQQVTRTLTMIVQEKPVVTEPANPNPLPAQSTSPVTAPEPTAPSPTPTPPAADPPTTDPVVAPDSKAYQTAKQMADRRGSLMFPYVRLRGVAGMYIRNVAILNNGYNVLHAKVVSVDPHIEFSLPYDSVIPGMSYDALVRIKEGTPLGDYSVTLQDADDPSSTYSVIIEVVDKSQINNPDPLSFQPGIYDTPGVRQEVESNLIHIDPNTVNIKPGGKGAVNIVVDRIPKTQLGVYYSRVPSGIHLSMRSSLEGMYKSDPNNTFSALDPHNILNYGGAYYIDNQTRQGLLITVDKGLNEGTYPVELVVSNNIHVSKTSFNVVVSKAAADEGEEDIKKYVNTAPGQLLNEVTSLQPGTNCGVTGGFWPSNAEYPGRPAYRISKGCPSNIEIWIRGRDWVGADAGKLSMAFGSYGKVVLTYSGTTAIGTVASEMMSQWLGEMEFSTDKGKTWFSLQKPSR